MILAFLNFQRQFPARCRILFRLMIALLCLLYLRRKLCQQTAQLSDRDEILDATEELQGRMAAQGQLLQQSEQERRDNQTQMQQTVLLYPFLRGMIRLFSVCRFLCKRIQAVLLSLKLRALFLCDADTRSLRLAQEQKELAEQRQKCKKLAEEIKNWERLAEELRGACSAFAL